MSSFLKAAKEVLEAANEPLGPRDITRLAVERGRLATSGLTPAQTMKSKLSTDIRLRGERSQFMRTKAGLFGLRKWKNRFDEYYAKRFLASLMDEDVLVFPAAEVREFVPVPGTFVPAVNSQRLLASCFSMRRREAEDRYDVVQLVSVFVLHHGDAFLTYKRSRRLPEARLHGTYSLAFGGHLNPEDAPPLLDITVPDRDFSAIHRELSEEVKLAEPPILTFEGLLYDDAREVSRQHVGVVYDVAMASKQYAIGERGFLLDPGFETISDIRGHIQDFENWSVILVNAVESGELPSRMM